MGAIWILSVFWLGLNWNSKIVGELSEVFADLGVDTLISSFFGRLNKHIRGLTRRIISQIVFNPRHVI